MSKAETKEDSVLPDQKEKLRKPNGTPHTEMTFLIPLLQRLSENDDQGKTTPRSLRHLEHYNAQGNVDEAHVKAALQRLSQAKISDALKGKARKHLCGHAKQMDLSAKFVERSRQKLRKESLRARKNSFKT